MAIDVEAIIAAVQALSPEHALRYQQECIELMHGQDIEFQQAIIAAQDQTRSAAIDSEGGLSD